MAGTYTPSAKKAIYKYLAKLKEQGIKPKRYPETREVLNIRNRRYLEKKRIEKFVEHLFD